MMGEVACKEKRPANEFPKMAKIGDGMIFNPVMSWIVVTGSSLTPPCLPVLATL